ncbi:MAG: type VI secretion system tube protein Hcp [Pararhodobacter sp.]|nr:type VI secretion system tube protein Hcp [Pararhodobacter sp.]
MAIYMKFGSIKGDATHEEHKDWLTIDSLQWGAGRGIMTPSGSTRNREASEPSVSEITVTKSMDSSSPSFFTEALTGNKGAEVKINLVSTGSPGRVFATYTLSDALVSGYNMSSGGDRPSESISINFSKIQFKYIPSKTEHGAGTPTTVSYDLATTKSG